MESFIDIIGARHSTRAYDGSDIGQEKKEALLGYLEGFRKGPFGNTVRFLLVTAPKDGRHDLGTQSMIRGAVLYLAGAVRKDKMAMEDFGYCMEAAVLKATGLGIGTCWLGGTLSRPVFADRIGLEKDELLPAVISLGYAGDKGTLIVRTMGSVFGNRNRKAFGDIFFDGTPGKSLVKEETGVFGTVLEAVRAAPSSSNRQPWRIIRDGADHGKFHLYLSENKIYNSVFGEVKLQNIDMGIALCHFGFTAGELGLKGRIVRADPGIDAGDLIYIASLKYADQYLF